MVDRALGGRINLKALSDRFRTSLSALRSGAPVTDEFTDVFYVFLNNLAQCLEFLDRLQSDLQVGRCSAVAVLPAMCTFPG
jgi:hypothetical protein